MEDKNIELLREAVENAINRALLTPKDFDLLSDRIYGRLGEMLSRNTLRRIWGNLHEGTKPRPSTLSVLARFIGYKNYDEFCSQVKVDGDDASSPIMAHRLRPGTGLTKGDKLRLTWLPDRVCVVQYNGSMHFTVLHSENTRLKEGDTFLCGLFIEGKPLYIDEWEHEDLPPTAYVCGKKSGIRFEDE